MEIKNLYGLTIDDFKDGLTEDELKELESFINDFNNDENDMKFVVSDIDENDTDEDKKKKTKKTIIQFIKNKCGIKKKKRKSKKDNMQTVNRYDIVDTPKWMTREFSRNAEGFLTGRAIVTNAGVFTYVNADGSKRRELRLPDEVFKKESLDSLKMKPLTNSHPVEPVTIDNVKTLQVGSTGTNPSASSQYEDGYPKNPEFAGMDFMDGSKKPLSDNFHLAIDMTITDEEIIKGIMEGNNSISCGYTVDLEETPGVWGGMPYDAIQRNIRYNHVAVNIPAARAGDAARIELKMDSKDAYSIDMNKVQVNNKKEVKMENQNLNLKTIKLDKIEYQAEEKVIQHLDAANDSIDELKAELQTVKDEKDKLQGEFDTKKDEVEKLTAEKEDAEKVSPEKLDEAVKERITVLSVAEKCGIKVKTDNGEYLSAKDLSNLDAKKQVILKAFPDSKLDEASDAYIDGRFDSAIPILEAAIKNETQNAQDISTFGNNSMTIDGQNLDVNPVEMHKQYSQNLTQAYLQNTNDQVKN
jgi:hypothetical protein